MPVNQNPNLTPPTQAPFELHDTAAIHTYNQCFECIAPKHWPKYTTEEEEQEMDTALGTFLEVDFEERPSSHLMPPELKKFKKDNKILT